MLKLIRKFLDASLQNMVNSNYTSKWIILSIDVLITTFSILLVYSTGKLLYPAQVLALPSLEILIILNAVLNALFFITFKSHWGIVRFSTYQEVWRFFIATFCANLGLLFLTASNGYSMPIITNLVIRNFTFSVFFLLAFRNITVLIYSILTRYAGEVCQRGLVFGTGPESIATAHSIFIDKNKDYKLVGFLTTDKERSKNRILDLPVYYLNNNLDQIVAGYKINTLIFSERKRLHEEQENLLNKCINLNLKVMLAHSPQSLSEEESEQKTIKPIRKVQIEDLLGRGEIKISIDKIRTQIEGNVVLVTGAAGSIGSEIVRLVASFKPKLLILVDAAETPLHNLQLELEDNYKGLRFEAIIGDVRSQNRMNFVFRTYRPRIIYHAAAYKHVPLMEKNPCEAILANVYGTRNLANHALRFGAERFVMISTDKAVNPTNIMGASKRIAEIYVQSLAKYLTGKNNKLQFITTRFGNVLGSNGSVIPRFRQQIEEGGPITVTHPDITRYFMTIPEACRLVLEAGNMGKNGEIYVFDMGNPVKISDLATRMIELAGLIPGKDIKISYTGLRPGEKLYEELLNDKEYTKPTKHDKIMIADVREYEFREVLKAIDELLELSRKIDVIGTVRKMKDLVPEFKSNNSIFEELDIIPSDN